MHIARRTARGHRRRRSGNPLLGQLLTAAVESAADAVAIRAVPGDDSAEVRELSYRDCDEASSRLARELIGRGIGPGDAVVVGIGRSVESVLAVWAIAKTGAVYVPVDPASGSERIGHIVAETGAALGLTTTRYRAALGDTVAWVELDDAHARECIDARAAHPISYTDRVRLLTEQHPAYILYPAGRPEGAVVTHTGLATVLNAAREHLGVHGDSRVLQLSPPDSDIAVLELLLTFSSGALLIVPPADAVGADDLVELVRRERVTHLLAAPEALGPVDASGLAELEVVALVGDRYDPALLGGWLREERACHTACGFPEATMLDTISGVLRPGDLLTIGAPIPGIGAFVLDSRLRPVPAGMVGELYLSGPVVAQGYSGRPGSTAGRFVAGPFGAETGQSGMRLFRTGDLVRRNDSDGSIEFVGRIAEPVYATGETDASAVEQTVVAVFATLLGVAPERIEPGGDFFELGGDSPLAAQAAAQIGAALELWVPVRFVFEARTVRGLADRVARYRESASVQGLRPMPRPGRIPLSGVQQRLWFRNRFDPSSAADNVAAALRLRGRLDIAALRSAVRDLVLRHEVLRTVYPEFDGAGYQLVLPITDPRATPDVPALDVADGDLGDELTGVVGAGFDVTTAPPVRLRVCTMSETDHVLVAAVHHIVADDFSSDLLLRDLLCAYRDRLQGEQPQWSPLEVQYADYALWQHEVLGSEDDPDSVLSQQITFWDRELSGLPEQWDLPVEQPRSRIATPHGARLDFEIGARVHNALIRLADERGVTMFTLIHAALAVLLARLSASRDIAIGTSFVRRGDETAALVGAFANTVVLRTGIDPGSGFADLLASVRERESAAFDHADVPFEQLVQQWNPVRSVDGKPLVPVLLTVANQVQISSGLPDLTVSRMEFAAAPAEFDIQLTVTEYLDETGSAQGIHARFSYVAELFDDSTVRDIAHRFGRVLDAVIADADVIVGDIDVLMPGERELVLREWNTTGSAVPSLTLPDLVAQQAGERPAAIAVRCGDTVLTFGELLRRANRVARALIESGAGPESLVAVAVERTAELPVALLAVLLSGAAYVPVDVTASAQQVEFVLADAAPHCVLTADVTRMFLPHLGTAVVRMEECERFSDAPVTDADRIAPLHSRHPACVLYESVAPVCITHRSVLELFTNARPLSDFAETDVWALCHSYAADLSLWELWGALAIGAAITVVDTATAQSPELLRERLISEQVTVLQQTSAEFAGLVEADRTATGSESGRLALRYVVIGGAELDPVAVQRWYDRHDPHAPQLVAMYGHIETTMHTSFLALDRQLAEDPAHVIGRALPGSACFVLDDRLHPSPMGVAGEIYIAGGQLPRGYSRRPALTATHFVANPFGEPGSRMYRTSDVARWIGFDGEAALEYVERRDRRTPPTGTSAGADIARPDPEGAQPDSASISAVSSLPQVMPGAVHSDADSARAAQHGRTRSADEPVDSPTARTTSDAVWTGPEAAGSGAAPGESAGAWHEPRAAAEFGHAQPGNIRPGPDARAESNLARPEPGVPLGPGDVPVGSADGWSGLSGGAPEAGALWPGSRGEGYGLSDVGAESGVPLGLGDVRGDSAGGWSGLSGGSPEARGVRPGSRGEGRGLSDVGAESDASPGSGDAPGDSTGGWSGLSGLPGPGDQRRAPVRGEPGVSDSQVERDAAWPEPGVASVESVDAQVDSTGLWSGLDGGSPESRDLWRGPGDEGTGPAGAQVESGAAVGAGEASGGSAGVWSGPDGRLPGAGDQRPGAGRGGAGWLGALGNSDAGPNSGYIRTESGDEWFESGAARTGSDAGWPGLRLSVVSEPIGVGAERAITAANPDSPGDAGAAWPALSVVRAEPGDVRTTGIESSDDRAGSGDGHVEQAAGSARSRGVRGGLSIVRGDSGDAWTDPGTGASAISESPYMAPGFEQGIMAGHSGAALPQALGTIVEEDPDGPALMSGTDEISYRELDARSSQLARVLIARDCGPGVDVAVRFDRGIDAAVAVWAVLKAGAAVVFTEAGTPDAEIGLTAVRDPRDVFEWLVLTDAPTAADIAAESTRPVTYADRSRSLRGGDPAFRAGDIVLSYDELAAAVGRLRSGTELDVESRTFHSGISQSPAAMLEIVAAGAAGATMALPESADAAALAGHWVTHLFSDPDMLAHLDPAPLADLVAVVLDYGPVPAVGFGAAETFVVLEELFR